MSENALTVRESLEKVSTYDIKGKRFLVQPVFKEDGKETLGTILLRLMTAHIASPQA